MYSVQVLHNRVTAQSNNRTIVFCDSAIQRFNNPVFLRIKCFCENLRNLRETNLKLNIFAPKKPDKIYYRKCLNFL